MLRSTITKSVPLSLSSSLRFPSISSSLSRPFSSSAIRTGFQCAPRHSRTGRFVASSPLSRSEHSSIPSSSEARSPDISSPSSSASSSPSEWHDDVYDPFASFDLFRRQVDRMFRDFDRQMFGGASHHLLMDDQDPFDVMRRVETGGQQRGKHPRLSSGRGRNQGQGQGREELKDQDQEEDHSPTVLQAVDGSNDVGEQSTSTSHRPLTRSPYRSNLMHWPFGLSSSSPALSPLPRVKLDLIEEKNQYVLNADVPGFNRDDLKLSVHNGMLTLCGETKQEKEEKDDDTKYHRIERTSGKITRSIPMPTDVKEDEIRASCEHGVLKVVLPKDLEAKVKKQEKAIQIQ